MWSDFREDLRAYAAQADNPPGSTAALVARVVLLQRLQAVFLVRLASSLRWAPARTLVKALNTILTGADISSEARIGAGLQLFHPTAVVIGPRCVVGRDCRIMQGVTLGHAQTGSPTLGDHVFIGSNAVIVGGITVGDYASIGANSVLSKSVPDHALVRTPKPTITVPESAGEPA